MTQFSISIQSASHRSPVYRAREHFVRVSSSQLVIHSRPSRIIPVEVTTLSAGRFPPSLFILLGRKARRGSISHRSEKWMSRGGVNRERVSEVPRATSPCREQRWLEGNGASRRGKQGAQRRGGGERESIFERADSIPKDLEGQRCN